MSDGNIHGCREGWGRLAGARIVVRVRRNIAVLGALVLPGLALREAGLVVPPALVWYIVQTTFTVVFMVGALGAMVRLRLADDTAGRAGQAIVRAVGAGVRAALGSALLLTLVLLPVAPLAPLAPRLAPWAWWALALLTLLAPLIPLTARSIPHRLWWLLDRRAYRRAPGWGDAAATARAAVERVWAACYPDDDRPRRALEAAAAFQQTPTRTTARAARDAAGLAHEMCRAGLSADAGRRTRQTVAAGYVALAVARVVEAMQPDTNPRAWRWLRGEADDALRRAEEVAHDTVLDDLDTILAEDMRLYLILHAINADPIVFRLGLTLTRAQLTCWLATFRDGVAYMARTYGKESLPWGWALMGGTAKQRWQFARRAHMGYVPATDIVCISAPNLAFQARSFGTGERFLNHKLAAEGAPAETFVLLEAVEECYHRYQFKALGQRGYSRRDHPIERDILPIWRRANDDLGLGLRFADNA